VRLAALPLLLFLDGTDWVRFFLLVLVFPCGTLD